MKRIVALHVLSMTTNAVGGAVKVDTRRRAPRRELQCGGARETHELRQGLYPLEQSGASHFAGTGRLFLPLPSRISRAKMNQLMMIE